MTIDRFPVERGHVQIFARAIGDPNPVYHDDDEACRRGLDGVIAPPTFTEAGLHFDPDFPYRPAIGRPWFGSASRPSSGPPPVELSGTGFHAETHLEYARMLRPGDVLHAVPRDGASWSKLGRRGGTLRFTEHPVDYVDMDGKVLVRCRTVGVETEHVLGDAGSGDLEPDGLHETDRGPAADTSGPALDNADRRVDPGEVAVGDERCLVAVRDLTRAQILMYAGASGDFSPQHTDEVYARHVGGYPTVFAHGMLTMAMTGRVVTDWFGPQRLVAFGMRFLGQVWPGDTLTVRARVSAVHDGQVEVDLVTVTQREVRVAAGYAKVAFV